MKNYVKFTKLQKACYGLLILGLPRSVKNHKKYLEKTWNYSGEMHSTKITQTFEQTSKHATGKFCL